MYGNILYAVGPMGALLLSALLGFGAYYATRRPWVGAVAGLIVAIFAFALPVGLIRPQTLPVVLVHVGAGWLGSVLGYCLRHHFWRAAALSVAWLLSALTLFHVWILTQTVHSAEELVADLALLGVTVVLGSATAFALPPIDK